jgi:hypothetical protein
MEVFEIVVGLVGTALGVIGCAPMAVAFARWQRRRASAMFEHAVAPILHDLEACFRKQHRPEQRRILVRDAVRLASLVAFRRDRPDPDAASHALANARADCRFCGQQVDADSSGSCDDCGLGARHWCCTPADGRKHLAVARVRT